jgi:phage terminase large subunit GpA-like protein
MEEKSRGRSMVTVRNKRGFSHQEWQKMRERNEALDCRVYARAAAWILGADRWDEATWRSLENQAGVETRSAASIEAVATEPIEPTTPPAPTAGTILTPRRRRTGAVTPSYLRK